MNLTNITDLDLETYKPRIEIVTIFPPGWKEDIEKFKKDNWQNKRLLGNIYKYQDNFWNYMKENNIIPVDIINEIENNNIINNKLVNIR